MERLSIDEHHHNHQGIEIHHEVTVTMSETTYEVTANAEDEEGDNEGTMATTTAHDGEEEEKKGAEKKKGRKKKGTTATPA